MRGPCLNRTVSEGCTQARLPAVLQGISWTRAALGPHGAGKGLDRLRGCCSAGQVRKTVEREVRVLRAVAHVNIVALLDVFRVAGRTHLVFEYVERTVLEALKVHPRGLGGLATRRIMWQLVQAVGYLHSQKVGGLRLPLFCPSIPCALPGSPVLCNACPGRPSRASSPVR